MPGTSPPDDQALLDFRNATNFRTVKRSDPHVAEILETSVYSVIYQWDEGSDKWEKKNQEGPLFVVRREKSPEYSLYMLNRQTVKNPAIPLVPGEMKMTVLDQEMMQVARRGDKTRTAVWFSEGAEMVEKFRRTILGICGEPSKRPNAVASPAVPPPRAGAAPQPDGLAKLFAGITMTPPVQSPSPAQAAPTARAAPSVPTPTSLPTPNAAAAAPSPAAIPAPVPVPVPAASAAPSAPSPSTAGSLSDKGRTADDLLMSILGLGSPTPAAPGRGISPKQPRQQQQQQQAPPHRPSPVQQQQQQQRSPHVPTPPMDHPMNRPPYGHNLPPSSTQAHCGPMNEGMGPYGFKHPIHFTQPSIPPTQPPMSGFNDGHGSWSSAQSGQTVQAGYPGQPGHPGQQPQPDRNPKYAKVGDATYAQTINARGMVPPHFGDPGQLRTVVNRVTVPIGAGANPEAFYRDLSGPGQNGQNGQNGQSAQRPGAGARAMMGEAVVDGVVKQEAEEGGRLWGVGLGVEERKAEFRRRLTDLILSDQEFVDGIWDSYIERMITPGSVSGQWNEG
ncbi:hypothetical protein IAT38_005436 [Cryptococcus sp. DSM 104549]